MLRDFQQKGKQEILQAWGEPGVYNVMPVFPTGSGKTVLVCDTIASFDAPTCAIAHRQELVGQLALALNREKIPHGIIAPKVIQQQIIALEHDSHGYSCYSYRASVRVAGVDTLRNHDRKDRWLNQVKLVVQDEGHHVLKENKWGRAMEMFPNARGLFPTAHAVRADGSGLGRRADGLVDRLVIGPHGRALIERGFLTDYRLVCVGNDIDFSSVPIGATGDYSLPQLRAATHSSNRIVGDVIKHYLKFAAGQLGVTFAVDIQAARDLAAAYRTAGVPAEIITAETPLRVRGQLMRQFRARRVLQLVSVDCLGEGVDVPGIEVVSLVRKTASWQLMCQQIGRALRVMVDDALLSRWGEFTDVQRLQHITESAKPKAIIIDHVGNIAWHYQQRGMPCWPQEYSLTRRDRKSQRKLDVAPLRYCLECAQPYERVLLKCPYCGADKPEPTGRSSPEMVEGDLVELDPNVLEMLYAAKHKVDGPCHFPRDATPPIRGAILRNHHDRAKAQQELRASMELWGGYQYYQLKRSDREIQRRFFHAFGTDVVSAQSLGATEAIKLKEQLDAWLQTMNVVRAA